jgi:WD40 repeat protein
MTRGHNIFQGSKRRFSKITTGESMFKKPDTPKTLSCLILVLLANSLGCVLGGNITAATISPTQSPTAQITAPTPIPSGETQWPALEGTPIPIPETPITAENVQQIARLARLGKGILNEEIAWSPDSKLIAGGSDIGVYVYDVQAHLDSDHVQQETLFIEADQPKHIAFSPDGKLLAAVVNGGTYVALWQIVDGHKQATFSGQSGITSLAFSPDGQQLAIGMQNGGVKLWEIASGQEQYTLLEHTTKVTDLAFSPDGQMLASAQDTKVVVWQTGSGQNYRAFTDFDDPIRDLAFSASGEIATLSGANDVEAWQIETAHPISMAFQPDTPNGTAGIFYSADGQLQAWYIYDGLHQVDAVNNVEIAHYDYLIKGVVYRSAFSPDMRSFAMSIGGTIWIKNLGNSSSTFFHAGVENGPALLSSDGKLVIKKRVELYHHAEVWDVMCGCKLHGNIGGTNIGTNQISFTPDGMLAMVNGSQGQLALVNVASGQTHRTFEPASVMAFAFSPDGQTVAIYAGAKSTEVSFWNVSDGQKLSTLPGNAPGLAYSPNGEILASSSDVGPPQLLRVKDDFSLIMTMPYDNMNAGHFGALTFSPDGSMLIGTTNELLIGWQASIGRVAYALPNSRHTHMEGIFAYDGEMFVYPTTENTVAFLNTKTGQKLHEIPADTRHVAFSTDGKFLVVAAQDGTIQIWGIP